MASLSSNNNPNLSAVPTPNTVFSGSDLASGVYSAQGLRVDVGHQPQNSSKRALILILKRDALTICFQGTTIGIRARHS